MFIKSNMDISGNFEAIMLQYNLNMYDYNQNIRLYLEIVRTQQRMHRNSTAYYDYPTRIRTIPLSNGTNTGVASQLLNSLFSNAFLRREPTSPLFQDVIVRPTQQQVRDATEMIVFTEHDETILNTSCPITLESFYVGERICRIKHCSHSFKRNAIVDWFSRNVRCPVCRFDIRETGREDSEREREEEKEEREEERESESEFNDVIDELLQERNQAQRQTTNHNRTQSNGLGNTNTVRPTSQTRTQTHSSFTQNLTNAIRNFVSNEIHNLPFDMNSAATELFYTFDIPLTFDISRNSM